jgi:hypothetical protein
MAKRSQPDADIESLRRKLVVLLDNFSDELKKPDLRAKVVALVPAFRLLRNIGSSLIPRNEANNARDRIIAYLRKYPFKVISGEELMVVSGIQDYPRRTRELRVQFGWWIFSGVRFKEIVEDDPAYAIDIEKLLGIDPLAIKPDQYVLMREDEDRDAAYRWNLMNEIRKEKTGVRDKILKYLRSNVGKSISGEELAYLAAGAKEWARRVRELRTEFGWPVVTKNAGRPDLRVGEYLLEEDRQAYEHDRTIPDSVRVAVLDRDHGECQICGWTYRKAAPGDPRKMLELHHVTPHADRGENDPDNLITLCNVHHDDVHAGRIAI